MCVLALNQYSAGNAGWLSAGSERKESEFVAMKWNEIDLGSTCTTTLYQQNAAALYTLTETKWVAVVYLEVAARNIPTIKCWWSGSGVFIISYNPPPSCGVRFGVSMLQTCFTLLSKFNCVAAAAIFKFWWSISIYCVFLVAFFACVDFYIGGTHSLEHVRLIAGATTWVNSRRLNWKQTSWNMLLQNL